MIRWSSGNTLHVAQFSEQFVPAFLIFILHKDIHKKSDRNTDAMISVMMVITALAFMNSRKLIFTLACFAMPMETMLADAPVIVRLPPKQAPNERAHQNEKTGKKEQGTPFDLFEHMLYIRSGDGKQDHGLEYHHHPWRHFRDGLGDKQ